MGSGLCRSTDGGPRAAGVDGLYRKIVFNYAKQWTRSNKRPKRDKTNTKYNKRDKPIISGPFPVDPDRLEGDKWRYVILTRLDTEPPPERPPRTKRRRRSQQQQQQQQQQQRHGNASAAADGLGGVCGLWGSLRRRRSHGRARPSPPPPPPPPPRPCRRRANVAARLAGRPWPAADRLTELVVLAACHRAPVDRSLPWPCGRPASAVGSETPPPAAVCERTEPSNGTAERRNGLFSSVGRVTAMTRDLLSAR